MKTKSKALTPYQFFYANGGYCYDPLTETPEQGRRKCAKALAKAERLAAARGLIFVWERDQFPQEIEGCKGWPQYVCDAHTPEGKFYTSLSGITFKNGGTPLDDTYRRVVEAELASQYDFGVD